MPCQWHRITSGGTKTKHKSVVNTHCVFSCPVNHTGSPQEEQRHKLVVNTPSEELLILSLIKTIPSPPSQKHKGVNQHSKYITWGQQQRPESPTVTLTWHACKYKVHKLHQFLFSVTGCGQHLFTGHCICLALAGVVSICSLVTVFV